MDFCGALKRSVELAPFTTFGIGGRCEYLARPRSLAELKGCIDWARQMGLPVFCIGGGSNVLIDDHGIPGLVILTRDLTGLKVLEDAIEAEAGVLLSRIVSVALKLGWEGYEFLAGIPGTVGGAVVTNAGVGPSPRQISYLIESVWIVDPQGNVRQFKSFELQPCYRHTALSCNKFVVYKVRLRRLGQRQPEQIRQQIKDQLQLRKRSHPYRVKSAGSIFKNPRTGRPAWWYIREAGCSGLAVGGAEVSTRHANWIINKGNASSADVHVLIEQVQSIVYARFGIVLEREIVYLPQDCC